MTNAACTIVSKNYLHYARTLQKSFSKHNPNSKFFILLVDEEDGELDISKESCEIFRACDLGISRFHEISFKYDIVEFNTSVKATFLKYLQENIGIDNILYIDPDIEVFHSLDFIYKLLDDYSIVLTPHTVKPIEDNLKPKEQDYLKSGTFNLGFIGVGHNKEAKEFLNWWETRLMDYCYNEPRSGLFTDQKWIDLVPSFYDNYYILKDVGCNIAYWNFHERVLSKKDGQYFVNENTPLKFFHFSGLNIYNDMEISKYQNRYDLNSREDLKEIFTQYRKKLINNGYEDTKRYTYTYGKYSNGKPISNLARKLYACNLEKYADENPFDSNSKFYKWVEKNHLISEAKKVTSYNSMNYNKNDYRLKVIHFTLKSLLKIVGVNRYEALMKYFRYISVLRNQKEIFK